MYFEDTKHVKSDQVEAELKQRSVSKEEQDKMLKLLQREQCLSSDDEGTITFKCFEEFMFLSTEYFSYDLNKFTRCT